MPQSQRRGGRRSEVASYLEQMADLLGSIEAEPVEATLQLLREAWQGDNGVFICGNGGSASTASHMANDLSKQTLVPGRRPLRALSLSDSAELITAWANDAGFDRVYAEQLRVHARPGDVLICISCSGQSENILAAAAEARAIGVRVIGFGGFDGGALAGAADVYIHVPARDYGVIESAHLVLEHCLAGLLREGAWENRRRPAPATAKPVVLVDRDGVLNRNLDGGVRAWDDFEFLPGALDGVAAPDPPRPPRGDRYQPGRCGTGPHHPGAAHRDPPPHGQRRG